MQFADERRWPILSRERRVVSGLTVSFSLLFAVQPDTEGKRKSLSGMLKPFWGFGFPAIWRSTNHPNDRSTGHDVAKRIKGLAPGAAGLKVKNHSMWCPFAWLTILFL